MQQVDFFDSRWHTENTSVSLFFIYDRGGTGDLAQLSIDAKDQSTSVNVHNPSAKDVMFLPVDHNLDIRKEGSNDMDSTCDYLLTAGGKELIVFGEIKTGRKGWAGDGMKQIKHTIDIFRANHDLSEWSQCRSYVSNYRHWRSRSSTRCVEETFKAETGGLRLYIQNDVNLDGEQS